MKRGLGRARGRALLPGMLAACIAAPPLTAEPLDLSDPTPRAVVIWSDLDRTNAGVGVHGSNPPHGMQPIGEGSFGHEAGGAEGVIRIASAEIEAGFNRDQDEPPPSGCACSNCGPDGLYAIPGSFSEYVIRLDLNDPAKRVTSATLSGRLQVCDLNNEVVTASQDLDSFGPAGYFLESPCFETPDAPLFCTSTEFCWTCTLVSGEGYAVDPALPGVGLVNAIGPLQVRGQDFTVALFSVLGDLGFSELEPVPALGRARAALAGAAAAAIVALGAGLLARLRGRS